MNTKTHGISKRSKTFINTSLKLNDIIFQINKHYSERIAPLNSNRILEIYNIARLNKLLILVYITVSITIYNCLIFLKTQGQIVSWIC